MLLPTKFIEDELWFMNTLHKNSHNSSYNPAIINVDIYNKFTKMQILICAVIVDVFT